MHEADMRSSAGAGTSRGNLALGALALGAFAIGTAELVVIGILNLIAKDTAVSISSAGQLITAYALGIAIGAPLLTAFTYLTPFLGGVTGVSGGLVSVFLLVFGLAAAAGTLLGGRAADHSATTTLLVANIVLLGALGALGALYLVGATPVLVLFALAAWGLAGIAAGSLIGGVALARHGASAPLLVATTMCALAIPATWATRFLTPPAEDPSNTAAVDLNGSGLQIPQLGLQGT
jgi:DHA1 family inner membrane transport protein